MPQPTTQPPYGMDISTGNRKTPDLFQEVMERQANPPPIDTGNQSPDLVLFGLLFVGFAVVYRFFRPRKFTKAEIASQQRQAAADARYMDLCRGLAEQQNK